MKTEILSRPMRTLVLVVACLSLFGALVAGLYGDQVAGPLPGTTDSYASGPLGHRALVALLEAQGVRVARLRGTEPSEPALPLFFLEPTLEAEGPRGSVHLSEELDQRIQARLPTLLALPKWDLEMGRRELTAVKKSDSTIQTFLSSALPQEWPSLTVSHPPWPEGVATSVPGQGALDGVRLSLVAPLTVALPEGFGEVLLGTREHALIARLPDGRGPFFLVAEPDLFHNFNIHQAENGVVLPLLAAEQLSSARLLVDELFHGHARQLSIWAALGEFPQRLIVLHGLALGLVALSMGRRRFGPPVALRPRRGRGPGEVLAVTATLLAHGQAAGTLARHYLDTLLADLASRMRIDGPDHSAELARRLDEAGSRRGLEPCLVRLRNRLRETEALSEGEALRLACRALRRHGELLPWAAHERRGEDGGGHSARTGETS